MQRDWGDYVAIKIAGKLNAHYTPLFFFFFFFFFGGGVKIGIHGD